MDGGRSTRRWSLDEKNWSRGWWIPLVVVVLAAATWGFLGFVEGGCKRGPRGGCIAADGYELRSWVLFLASMPTLFVVGTGLTADRWPPALGVAGGGAACGLYTLAQGHTVPHLIMAAVLFALAITAPALAWRRRRAARAESLTSLVTHGHGPQKLGQSRVLGGTAALARAASGCSR